MKAKKAYLLLTIMLLVPCISMAQSTPVEDKIAVLITGWGMPAGFSFGYAWTSPDKAQIGDKTDYEGQPCKFGHVGTFPYQSHINMIPWAITFQTEGSELFYDYHGIYRLENGVYVNASNIESVQDATKNVLPDQIPPDIPVTALADVKDQSGNYTYPRDTRDGTDHLAGWYRIGSFQKPFPNGLHDFHEANPAFYTRYYGVMGVPSSITDPSEQHPAVQAQDEHLEQLMEAAFGDRIDMRFGYYTAAPGKTRLEDDVAEEFANDGFTNMIVARETTDHNHYANDFMSLNYVKERLCEINKLDAMTIYQTRQIGRTPEFNAMNVRNLEPYIKSFQPGSTIGIIYVTRGLTWGKQETAGNSFGAAHPWSKEVYHENAYLNYLSWKKALQDAFGGDYSLVFTKGSVASDLREDNFFTYGLSTDIDLKGYSGESIYYSIRQAIQFAKEDGIDKIIIAPCHWNYDNLDNIFRMKEMNNLPITPKADLENGEYANTHCEDEKGNWIDCSSADSAAKIIAAPSFSNLPEEFATAYYVVLRGTLERFGLYPQDAQISISEQQPVAKIGGGTVAVQKFFSPVNRAKIVIPPDPYPDRPESFTDKNAIPVNDPDDTYDCMWDDTNIIIGQQSNPPAMNTARAVGPAVHFGPYRTFFNRDVTITIPYRRLLALGKTVKAYVYNHVTKDWDALDVEKTENGTVTFKTKVLGLFRAGVE